MNDMKENQPELGVRIEADRAGNPVAVTPEGGVRFHIDLDKDLGNAPKNPEVVKPLGKIAEILARTYVIPGANFDKHLAAAIGAWDSNKIEETALYLGRTGEIDKEFLQELGISPNLKDPNDQTAAYIGATAASKAIAAKESATNPSDKDRLDQMANYFLNATDLVLASKKRRAIRRTLLGAGVVVACGILPNQAVDVEQPSSFPVVEITPTGLADFAYRAEGNKVPVIDQTLGEFTLAQLMPEDVQVQMREAVLGIARNEVDLAGPNSTVELLGVVFGEGDNRTGGFLGYLTDERTNESYWVFGTNERGELIPLGFPNANEVFFWKAITQKAEDGRVTVGAVLPNETYAPIIYLDENGNFFVQNIFAGGQEDTKLDPLNQERASGLLASMIEVSEVEVGGVTETTQAIIDQGLEKGKVIEVEGNTVYEVVDGERFKMFEAKGENLGIDVLGGVGQVEIEAKSLTWTRTGGEDFLVSNNDAGELQYLWRRWGEWVSNELRFTSDGRLAFRDTEMFKGGATFNDEQEKAVWERQWGSLYNFQVITKNTSLLNKYQNLESFMTAVRAGEIIENLRIPIKYPGDEPEGYRSQSWEEVGPIDPSTIQYSFVYATKETMRDLNLKTTPFVAFRSESGLAIVTTTILPDGRTVLKIVLSRQRPQDLVIDATNIQALVPGEPLEENISAINQLFENWFLALESLDEDHYAENGRGTLKKYPVVGLFGSQTFDGLKGIEEAAAKITPDSPIQPLE